MCPICSRVFFNSVAIAVCPCVAICAEFETPSCSAFVTLSSRCDTLCPIVAICPELCACAVPIVCKPRRSSLNCPSSTALFFCSCEVCNTSHSTSPATTITTPISTPVIPSPVHPRETVSLLYPHLSPAESARQKKKGFAFTKPFRHLVQSSFVVTSARRFSYQLNFRANWNCLASYAAVGCPALQVDPAPGSHNWFTPATFN